MKRIRKWSLAAMALVLLLTVGATGAWLIDRSARQANTFLPAHVTCQVEESFSGREKTSIALRNTGNVDAFLRLRLVSYRINAQGQRIGGAAPIPALSLGGDWLAGSDGCYYYVHPVSPGGLTGNLLSQALSLTAYDDADGGVQVIEVVAEAIQALPAEAVQGAWPAVTCSGGQLTANPGKGEGA